PSGRDGLMYPQSFKLTIRLYPYVLLVIGCHLAFGFFSEILLNKGGLVLYPYLVEFRIFGKNFGSLVSFLADGLLAFAVYRSVLKISLADQQVFAQRLVGFILIFLGISIAANIPVIIFDIFWYFEIVDPFSKPVESWGISSIVYANLFNILFSVLIISLLGTLLPANAATHQNDLGEAFRRGKASFWFVLLRLVVGPGALVVLASTLQAGLNLGIEGLGLTGLFRSFVQLIDVIILYFIMAWVTVMTAWIFSEAYLKANTTPEEAA
ncbi:MAG: hypothetical protein V7727_21115, partial [Sneathiella sp.]